MYGFFKNKRIVLYDTLIQQVSKPFFLDFFLSYQTEVYSHENYKFFLSIFY